MITFELKAKDDYQNLHVFQDITSTTLIHLIENDPATLVNIIKEIERSLTPGGSYQYNDIIISDSNVYI